MRDSSTLVSASPDSAIPDSVTSDSVTSDSSIPVEATILFAETGQATPESRIVPEEAAVNIVYGNVPFAVMMMSPADFDDFAIGFSLTEGIISDVRQLRRTRLEADRRGFRLLIDLTGDALHRHFGRRRRSLAGRTGCGVCGIDDLAELPFASSPSTPAPSIDAGAIWRALAELERKQPLNRMTHAVHAAAFADFDGAVVAVREDVGRHNALDKLIGAVLRDGIAPASGFVIVTSRCSFEMVEKVAAFGCRSLVAISAPTSLALERATHHDMTLVGVARRDAMTVFRGIERFHRQRVPA